MYWGECSYCPHDERQRVTYTANDAFACERHTRILNLLPIDPVSLRTYPSSPFYLTAVPDRYYDQREEIKVFTLVA
jgi:hypothetical protein